MRSDQIHPERKSRPAAVRRVRKQRSLQICHPAIYHLRLKDMPLEMRVRNDTLLLGMDQSPAEPRLAKAEAIKEPSD